MTNNSLIDKLKAEFRIDSLQSPDWQRGFNEGLDKAIAIFRAHAVDEAADAGREE